MTVEKGCEIFAFSGHNYLLTLIKRILEAIPDRRLTGINSVESVLFKWPTSLPSLVEHKIALKFKGQC
jgi:hypothetical protein